MADVFISYKSDDRSRVQPLVAGLRAEGLSVWWDQDIPAGAPWEATIERQLKDARTTLVVWSPAAVVSENVKSEARWARGEGRLVQVFVSHCDPPLFFGERQGVTLQGWTGDAADHRFRTIVAAVQAVVEGRSPPEGVGYAPRAARWPAWALAVAATTVVVVATLTIGIAITRAPARPATTPADPAVTAARARQQLIQSVAGAWDREGGDCAAPLRISADLDRSGEARITVSGRGGFNSMGQVITAESGRIITRDVQAAGAAGETWEYQPSGALMTVTDAKGTPTTLKRCAAT